MDSRGLGQESGRWGSRVANYPTTKRGVTILREGVSIVKIIKKIEQHVSLAGDTETQRSQKTLAVIVFFVGAIITALDATNNYFMGLVALGTIYYVAAGVLAAGALCIVLFPTRYVIIVFFTLLLNMGTDVAAHVVMGGYLSGLLILPYSLLIPILAVLFLPRRHGAAAYISLFGGDHPCRVFGSDGQQPVGRARTRLRGSAVDPQP